MCLSLDGQEHFRMPSAQKASTLPFFRKRLMPACIVDAQSQMMEKENLHFTRSSTRSSCNEHTSKNLLKHPTTFVYVRSKRKPKKNYNTIFYDGKQDPRTLEIWKLERSMTVIMRSVKPRFYLSKPAQVKSIMTGTPHVASHAAA